MMSIILSAKIINLSAKSRKCASCNRYIIGRHLRLYGMADIGDKPHNVYVHVGCAAKTDPKIKAAIDSH